MPDPRILAYTRLCQTVALAGFVLWCDLMRETLAGSVGVKAAGHEFDAEGFGLGVAAAGQARTDDRLLR